MSSRDAADAATLAEIEVQIIQELVERSEVPVGHLYRLSERCLGRGCAAVVSSVLSSLLVRRIIELHPLRVKAATGSKILHMAQLN